MKRSFLAPEYHQVSLMDCGVGALSAFLRGYGLNASYERLRQSCQTSVDGTSIESIEELALGLGVDVVQHLIPVDMMFDGLEGRWPAIGVTSSPGQPPHFVTMWRKIGGWIHSMDPARGRTWQRQGEVERQMHLVTVPLDEESWRDWFATSSFREVLTRRTRRLLTRERAQQILEMLESPGEALELAAVDATLRLVAKASKVSPRRGAGWRTRLFDALLEAARERPDTLAQSLWSLWPTDDGLQVTAGVFLAVEKAGWVPSASSRRTGDAEGAPAMHPAAVEVLQREDDVEGGVWRQVYRLLSPSGRLLLVGSLVGSLVISIAAAFEILLVRAGSFDAARTFPVATSRIGVAGWALALFALLLLLDSALAFASRAIGRELEVRLREVTFLLLPRVDDNFVRSRPTGDLAYRAHGLELGRQFPTLVYATVRSCFDLFFSMLALAWIRPSNLPIILVGAAILTLSSLLVQNRFREIDTRFQAHGARLVNLFLDALRGFRPVRLHGFQPAFRAEQSHEIDLWKETGTMQARARALLQASQGLLTTLWVGALFWNDIVHEVDARTFVITAFWALRLPTIVSALLTQAQSYAPARSAFSRLLEIMHYGRADEPAVATDARSPTSVAEGPLSVPPFSVAPGSMAPFSIAPPSAAAHSTRIPGADLQLDRATVVVGGQPLLRAVSVHVPAGQHVAIVGASGSGKSTLVSLLLGFHSLAGGSVRVDGQELTPEVSRRLRLQTAWVDPAIQIWNNSFLENLEYAASGFRHRDLLSTLEASDLLGVLDGMDRGLDTAVGGEGRLLSGGEGQRLRLGRALLRRDVRLAVFDEAFRGLDRDTRKRLTLKARLALENATLFFVSHDISHALDFDRVLVIDGGRLVEDGHPLELSSMPSRFRTLLEAEREILGGTWAPRMWRRIQVGRGRLADEGGA